jgi:isopentenyl-diphosphate delta-isomerase type 2
MAVPTDPGGMTTRKRRHIDVCLDDRVAYSGVTTGLERYCLPYNALTQTSLAHIDLSTEFLGASLRAPILIGAMTGGAELSGTINRNLAAAAQRLGVGMMLGSQRIMLDSALGEEAASSFTVRGVAPDVLLFGNIGLSQLTVAAVDDISNALKRVGADVLAVHANPLQEAVQRNGDSDFAGSIDRLREVAGALEYPVLLKEVGHGIGASAVAELTGPSGEPPVAAIDVAGAGGTSWSRVEQLVRVRRAALSRLSRLGDTHSTGDRGGAGGAAHYPAGHLRRYSHRHGRGQSAGVGRRRGRDRASAARCGDRLFWRRNRLAAAVHRRAGNLPARCRGGRSSGPARYRRDTDAVSTGDWRPQLRRVNQAGSVCFVGLLFTVARAVVDLACCATSSLSNFDIAAIIAVNTR